MEKVLFLMQLIFFGKILAQPVLVADSINPDIPDQFSVYKGSGTISPGTGGANQVWDLSKTNFTYNNTYNAAYTGPGIPAAIACRAHNYSFDQTKLEISSFFGPCACTQKPFIFDDYAQVIQYPFTYKDSIADTFNAMQGAVQSQCQGQNIAGKVNTLADGYGTLILPFDTIRNVLRVKNTWITSYVAVDYLWYRNGHHLPIAGIYKSWIGESCSNYSFYSVYRLNPVGITDLENSNKRITVYPNPAGDKITFHSANSIITTVEIYDITLKNILLQKQNNEKSDLVLDLNCLQPGMYICQLSFSDGMHSVRKICKE